VYLVVFECAFDDGRWRVPEHSNFVWRVSEHGLNEWREFRPIALLKCDTVHSKYSTAVMENSQKYYTGHGTGISYLKPYIKSFCVY